MKNQSELFSKKLGYGFIVSNKFYKALTKYFRKIYQKHLEEGREQVVGHAFDDVMFEINLKGLSEKNELEAFFDWARDNKKTEVFLKTLALDIGANIGNHSLFFSKFFKQVISYEPNKSIYQLLAINTKKHKNILISNYGISNYNGTAEFEINNLNYGNSKIIKSKENTKTKNRIKVKKLDSIVNSNLKVSLIKIDVEGHEYQVLSGAAKTIKKNKPIILFEQHKQEFTVLSKNLSVSTKCIELLRGYGYRKFATIEYYPQQKERIKVWYYPQFLRSIFKIILLFINQPTIKIVTKTNFIAKKYPIIVAMP